MKTKNEAFEERYLNLLTDFGFHKIFGTESNKDLLIDFLNQVIKEEGHIVDIKYLNPEQLGEFEMDRKAIFDIFCITEKEEYFIVEMQKASQAFFRDRSIFYASLPIQKQAPQGDWNFRLNTVYFVAILDFVLFDEFEEDKEHVVEHVYLTRDRTKTLYTKKLIFAFVELPKFKKIEEELKTHFDVWLYLLKNLPKLKTRPMAAEGRIFEKLFKLAEVKRLKEKEMETYNKSILEYHDVRLCMDYALEKGIEEGLEKGITKGREEGKILVIQKCIQKDMSIEDIVFITGFSKEQIISYKMNGTL
jgi:predicted transposase/invertase (TIGR01784 family)